MGTTQDIRVAVLGYGAIGARVSESLCSGEVAGVILSGVITSSPERATSRGFRVILFEDALESCDLIVECATGEILRSLGPRIIRAGVDLLPASLGALADPTLRRALINEGPGRCFLTAGAIGGLDLLGAAAADGGLDRVSITSTKLASSLAQPWMSPEQLSELAAATEPFTLFEGSVQQAIDLYPASLNVAVALAAATEMWSEVRVRLVADPLAAHTNHRVRASGVSGEYDFSITNKPLPDSPASSGVVSAALLRGVGRIARPSGMFV